MLRNLVAFPLVLLAVALFPVALLVHTFDRTLLDRGFAVAAAPKLLASSADLASLAVAMRLKREHGVAVDRGRVRDLFLASVTDGTVEALVDAFYRGVDRAAETGRLRVEVPLSPLASGLRAFHDQLMLEVVLPALPKELPPGALERLDVDVARDLPPFLALDLGTLESAPLDAARWCYRHRGPVDAFAFGVAAFPLLLLFPLFSGRRAAALRWSALALIICATGVGLVHLLAYQALRFAELDVVIRPFGFGGLLDPLWTAASLFLAPAARAGYACLALALFALVVAAGGDEPRADAADAGPAAG